MERRPQAITVSKLQKSYKKVQVLRDVSFIVEEGTIFALLGSNGAGKTTTINILTTLLNADGGTATVSGFDVAAQAEEVRKHISLSGQFAAVDDILTARENLILIGELRHVKNPADTAEALLKKFDLIHAADLPSGTLSGGMRRRLDIAMSLIGDASVIFLDEPTAGLDPQSRNMMWETIKTLAKGGTTIFLTTQYLEEADQLADRIAILNQGRIMAEGTSQDLKKLLPLGKIELRFHSQKQLDAAAVLLESYGPMQDNDVRSLTIKTDGTLAQVARLFSQIQAANIETAEFSQKLPTLDDAFLKIINDNEGKK